MTEERRTTATGHHSFFFAAPLARGCAVFDGDPLVDQPPPRLPHLLRRRVGVVLQFPVVFCFFVTRMEVLVDLLRVGAALPERCTTGGLFLGAPLT